MSKAGRDWIFHGASLVFFFCIRHTFWSTVIEKVSNKWGMHVTIPVWASELWNISIFYPAYYGYIMTLSRSVPPNSIDSRFLCCCSVVIFVTMWTAAYQASLSFTISQSLLKLISIESVMPYNHIILCCPLLLPSIFPSSMVFSNESFFSSGSQSIEALASAL